MVVLKIARVIFEAITVGDCGSFALRYFVRHAHCCSLWRKSGNFLWRLHSEHLTKMLVGQFDLWVRVLRASSFFSFVVFDSFMFCRNSKSIFSWLILSSSIPQISLFEYSLETVVLRLLKETVPRFSGAQLHTWFAGNGISERYVFTCVCFM